MFNENELALLEGSPFLNIIKEKTQDIQEDFNQIKKVSPSFSEKFTFDMFKWARMCVSSRIYGGVINEQATDYFAPLADTLYH